MDAGTLLGGRFEIGHLAGAGGMGALYRATDRATGAPVAVKVLHALGEREEARFAREASVLAGLDHPAVVRYIAHGRAGTVPFLVMEWLEGETLAARLARAGLTVAESVAVAARVADALAAAHALGVVHRDVKPANVFLPDGAPARARVLDFGIARASGAAALTGTGALVGTPGYMAPEQCRHARDLDARADVFSLGCVLFECLAGVAPFEGDSVMAVLARILFEDAPRVREVRPDVPAALDDLVARMLARAPDERPRDGAAVAAALRGLGDVTGAAPGAPSGGRAAVEAITTKERRLRCLVVAPAAAPGGTLDYHDDALTPAREALEPLGASVEVMADGTVVATVAASESLGDQAARAARAALALRALRPGAPVALVTGWGEVGGRVSVGAAMDRAARLLRAPSSGGGAGVRVDDVTARLLGDRFVLAEGAGGVALRGERAAAAEGRSVLGRAIPCVGRDRELRALEDLYDECAGEPVARVALVTAAPGAGKSRVARELVQRVAARGAEVWVGGGDVVGAGSAFAALAPAVRRAAGVLEGEALADRRRKLAARVARHVPAAERARVAEFLGELVGAAFPDEGSVALRAARQAPMLMSDQIRRAWEDFVAAETRARPVLLVLEDLHWGDLPSVKLVDAALRRLADRPFMVLALARPEVHDVFPRLWAERDVQEVRLGALPRRASERLVREALGEAATPDVVERLVARAEGNPFYLEELVRAVAEPRGDALPDTVLAAVQARLAALDPEARRVLRAGSVFGEAFWAGGVAALLGGDARAADTPAWLDALVAREVVVRRDEARFPAETEYAFRHALLRDGAYSTLVGDDRALGHRLAARWLEQAGEADPMVLAEHYDRGEEPARAARWYLRAAEQALEGNDLDAAVARAEEGVRRDASGELLVDLWVVQAEAQSWRGDCERAAESADEVMALAAPGSRPWCRAAVARLLVAVELGRADLLFDAIGALMGVEPAPDATVDFLQGLAAIALACYVAGQIEVGDAHLARMEALGGALEGTTPRARAMLEKTRAWRAFWVEGAPAAALALARRAVASFEAAGDPRTGAFTEMDVANFAWALGRWEEAEASARAALAAAAALGLELTATLARVWLAFAVAARGRVGEAEAEARAGAEAARARGSHVGEALARWPLADALRLAGRPDEAEAEARVAIEYLAISPANRVAVQGTLARIQLARGRPEEALATAREALATVAELAGPVPHREPSLRLAYADALAATGDAAGARAALAEARARLDARAAAIADPDDRARYLAIADHARIVAEG